MPYQVVASGAASRAIRALPENAQRQVIAKMESLAADPRPPGARALAGAEDLWRVRSGDYRIVYSIEDRALIVLVVRVGRRGEVYRRLARRR